MKRSERMSPIIRVAQSKEQSAAVAYGQAQQRLEAMQRQLQELESYRIDYQRMVEQRGKTGISAASLQQVRGFLGQLDAAIAQQRQAVGEMTNACEQQRQYWLSAHHETRAVDTVAERYRERERIEAERREQKITDEMAALRVAHARRGRDD